jgi:hypothetical protein
VFVEVKMTFSYPIDDSSCFVGGVKLLFAEQCYEVAWLKGNYIAGLQAISLHIMKNGD